MDELGDGIDRLRKPSKLSFTHFAYHAHNFLVEAIKVAVGLSHSHLIHIPTLIFEHSYTSTFVQNVNLVIFEPFRKILDIVLALLSVLPLEINPC